MLSKREIKLRRGLLGASDIGVLLGLSKWKSPLDLYLEKRGESDSGDQVGNEYIYWGDKLELVLRKEFGRRNGVKVLKPRSRYYMSGYPYMSALLDGLLEVGVSGERELLEIKTTSAYNRGDWGVGDEVPELYMVQVQAQMLVTGIRRGWLVCLIGGQEYREYKIEYSSSLCSLILEKSREFWEGHVLKGVAPEPICLADMGKLYNRDSGESIESDSEIEHCHEELRDIKSSIRELKSRREALELKVKEYMKEKSLVVDSGENKLFSWFSSKRNSFDVVGFRRDNPELYKKYLMEKETRSFLIK